MALARSLYSGGKPGPVEKFWESGSVRLRDQRIMSPYPGCVRPAKWLAESDRTACTIANLCVAGMPMVRLRYGYKSPPVAGASVRRGS